MLKRLENWIRQIVLDELKEPIESIKAIVEELTATSNDAVDELRAEWQSKNHKWEIEVHTVGENDIVVFPADIPDEDFTRIAKMLSDRGVRGVIAADGVKIIEIT